VNVADQVELLQTEPVPRGAKVVGLGEVAVLTELGRGITELRPERVHHPLDVSRAWPGPADALVISSGDGAIHRFVPGAPPVQLGRVGAHPDRLTLTVVDGDRVLGANFGRLLDTISLYAGGKRRWWRHGQATPHLAGGDLFVRWDRLCWNDTPPALSRVDLETGRDRWRVGKNALFDALRAHPAHAEAARLVSMPVHERHRPPRPPSWYPHWAGAVGDRVWFAWGMGDHGCLLFALDRETGALRFATPLQGETSGHIAGHKLHLFNGSRYEIRDLARDGAEESLVSIKLPTSRCYVKLLLDDDHAFVVSSDGHLALVDPRKPDATRVLLHRRKEFIESVAAAGDRIFAVHGVLGAETAYLTTFRWNRG
jgi:hypothetical protein